MNRFQVRIGDDAHSQQDCAASAANCNNPNLFDIGRVLVHPNYDQPKYANDIALLSLRSQSERHPFFFTLSAVLMLIFASFRTDHFHTNLLTFKWDNGVGRQTYWTNWRCCWLEIKR